ncbi:hypothetical protein POX_a00462 [Penicillium oxalicum]|uniref:hypothetical protein n=1 Tax=Penicillium oxalicum TaxID=69781 RepID=UPI0020B7FF14|nr:hypothetical protein POX_a00462 [Penicillium oxalicum]KAI2793874.1 hypothetical protein POX_a00462 [Penicillium oxalicum]
MGDPVQSRDGTSAIQGTVLCRSKLVGAKGWTGCLVLGGGPLIIISIFHPKGKGWVRPMQQSDGTTECFGSAIPHHPDYFSHTGCGSTFTLRPTTRPQEHVPGMSSDRVKRLQNANTEYQSTFVLYIRPCNGCTFVQYENYSHH